MVFKRTRKSRPRKRRRNKRRKLMSTNVGPWLTLVLIMVVLIGGGILIYKYVLPPVLKIAGIQWPPAETAHETIAPTPAPTENPLKTIDMANYTTEIEILNLRFASDPYRYENEIVFAGGYDADGPRNSTMYIYDIATGTQAELSGIQVDNDDIFQPVLNARWIVWLDHKRNGGGTIKALDRQNQTIFTIKDYYTGQPVIHLENNLLCWTERTGTNMDKVFLYDLSTRDNLCLEMLERSVFGQSDSYLCESEVIWANYSVQSAGEDSSDMLGAIYSYPLDGTTSEVQIYETGTYVHDPMSNSEVRIWSDANHALNSNLWISYKGGTPKMIAANVTGYGLGGNFVAYCSDSKMYIYLWKENFTRMISLENEICIFSGVSGNAVFWYQMFEEAGISRNDIIKFITIDNLGEKVEQTSVITQTPLATD